MPLICWRGISFSLENMSQMSSTIRTNNLGSLHSESTIGMPGHSTWDVVEICWPPTARLELVVCLVEWCIAACAGVYSCLWGVFVIFASTWCFSALLSQDSKLFYSSLVMGLSSQWLQKEFYLLTELLATHHRSSGLDKTSWVYCCCLCWKDSIKRGKPASTW